MAESVLFGVDDGLAWMTSNRPEPRNGAPVSKGR
jgi:hypothetical protein